MCIVIKENKKNNIIHNDFQLEGAGTKPLRVCDIKINFSFPQKLNPSYAYGSDQYISNWYRMLLSLQGNGVG